MHSRVSLLLVAVLLGAALPSVGAPPSRSLAGARAPEGWPPLPPGTRTLLLLTGADLGHWEPRKCFLNSGGMLYRLSLDTWLFDHEPGIDWHWVSTGNVLSLTLENTSVRPPREIYEGLARIGYDVVGVGWHDLQLLGPYAIRTMTRDLPLYLVATNLLVLETGKPFLEGSAILETASGRIGVLRLLPYREEGAWTSREYGTVVISPPEQVLPEALHQLAGRVDRVLLLAELNHVQLQELLRHLPPDTPPVVLVVDQLGTYGKCRADDVGGIPVLWVGGHGQVLGRAALDARGELLEARGIRVEGTFPVDPQTGRILGEGTGQPGP